MSTITTRAGKGSPLTNTEMDTNLTNLNTDKLQSGDTAASLTITSATINGGTITGITDLAVADGGTGLSSLTTGYIPYGAGTSAFGSSANLFWDSANNRLGIGTASPVNLLTVESTSNVRATIRNSTENTSYGSSLDFATGSGSLSSTNVVGRVVGLITQADPSTLQSALAFHTNSGDSVSEKMRIDSSGNVGIGTTSPAVQLDVYNATSSVLSVDGDSNTSIRSTRYSTDATAPALNFRKARGTKASPATVATSDYTANLQANAYDGTAFRVTATIASQVETYTTTDNVSGNLIFLTRPTGVAASVTERMRIDSAGNVGIGTTAPVGKLEVAAATDKNLNIDASGIGSSLRISAINDAGSSNVNLTIQSSNTIFASSGTEYMRIDSAGNVGIGTTAPANKLQVTDGAASTTGVVRIHNPTNANNNFGAALLFSNENGGTKFGLGQISAIRTNNAVNYDAALVFSSSADSVITERMRIDSTGNVGIGQTTVAAKLGITQSSTTAYSLIAQTPTVGLTTGNYVNMAYFTNGRSTNNDGLRIVNLRDSTGSGVGNWETESYRIRRSVDQNDGVSGVQEEIVFGNQLLAFNTNGSERMRIHSSGGVSIGNTTDPGATNLSVTGTVSLTNGTSNLVLYNANGVNPPTFTTRSTGTKIVLYPNLGASASDFAIGIENLTLWNSVSDTTQQFKWYGGTTLAATLTGLGALTTVGKISDNKGDVRAAPIQTKASAYVLVASDAGQTIYISTGGVTINASVLSAGDMVTIINNSASNQTITAGASVTFRLAGTATTGNRTLAQRGMATFVCVVGGATPDFYCSGAGLT